LRELQIWLGRMAHQLREVTALRARLCPTASLEAVSLAALTKACAGVDPAAASTTTAREAAAEAASGVMAALLELASRARVLSDSMGFRFLYDDERRLFHMGAGPLKGPQGGGAETGLA